MSIPYQPTPNEKAMGGPAATFPAGGNFVMSSPSPYVREYQAMVSADSEMYVQPGAARRSVRSKIVKALLFIAAICAILSFASSSVVELGRVACGHTKQSQHSTDGVHIASNGRLSIEGCMTGDASSWSEPEFTMQDGRYGRSASFDLPKSADLFFLQSRGSLSHGKVDVVQSDGKSDAVKVDVIAIHSLRSMLDDAGVCRLTRGSDAHGVGIFTPKFGRTRWNKEQVEFHVRVTLPAGEDLLQIADFTSDMPNFAHTFPDLLNSVQFGTVSVKTANAPIHVESLDAGRVDLMTENDAVIVSKTLNAQTVRVTSVGGAIRGTYNASSSLDLLTSNAPIDVSVYLYDGGYTPGKASLKIATSNAPLAAGINLRESSAGAAAGFIVDAQTSNSPLGLAFNEQPVDSPLNLAARSSNGPVTAKMHAAFEGTFRAETSNARVTIVAREDVSDPAGRGRKRKASVYHAGSTTQGEIAWVPRRERGALGTAVLSTSNLPINLRF